MSMNEESGLSMESCAKNEEGKVERNVEEREEATIIQMTKARMTDKTNKLKTRLHIDELREDEAAGDG